MPSSEICSRDLAPPASCGAVRILPAQSPDFLLVRVSTELDPEELLFTAKAGPNLLTEITLGEEMAGYAPASGWAPESTIDAITRRTLTELVRFLPTVSGSNAR
jgi:hypothetical protein